MMIKKRTVFMMTVMMLITIIFFASCSSEFDITGKWKNVGTGTFGQAQENSIVVFDGTNCNFYSPNDTYSFDSEENILTVTSCFFSESMDFSVTIEDNNHIQINCGSNIVELQRVE